MAYFTHHFEAQIALHAANATLAYTVVYLDPGVQTALALGTGAPVRIEADVSGIPIKGAWQSTGDGRFYLMLPRATLKKSGLGLGSCVEVGFKVAPTADVDTPPALADALAADREFAQAWSHLTPGAQRGLAGMVANAKRPATVATRLGTVRAAAMGQTPMPWDFRARAKPSS